MPFRPDEDEDPSDEDQVRFGEQAEETGTCPDCGAEIYDNADICPKCFAYIGGDTLAKLPTGRPRGRFHKQWIILLVVLLIVSLLWADWMFIHLLFGHHR